MDKMSVLNILRKFKVQYFQVTISWLNKNRTVRRQKLLKQDQNMKAQIVYDKS